ncbi:polymorphic toxin immunity protein [Mycobacterium phage prophi104-2]|uniref:hypothetical protein n=1 Tax=Mycobacteroides abscessus TaxID=36809 RepID=UPI00092AF20C|nr:hypothetical protein [Mycobacteroides abscessus]QST89329.1 polymorphic toxin immunity protein [Mycobacterium phage prophi104-2]MBN7386160.1 hypothetical protein [Mycobacteroides abscessus subsp. abscessus]MBN7418929.1 hypothetical protein [Mycobacteroides abscessus subsp. abscessus]MBN7512622.1 hypothetical protein [Mycobacteroides abscessus subsp. massiliense]MBN7529407.1 hypothetical protein [Mycobacteroides abscessus subsp. abscessus]
MSLERNGFQMHTYTTDKDFIMWMGAEPGKAHRQIEINVNSIGEDRDGVTDVAFSIYKVPDGTEYDEFPYPREWIQTCGATTERLTVEVRRQESDGVWRMYTIGRPSAASESEQSETVYNGDNAYLVRPSEVLTAAEAIELFQHYYDHLDVAPGWHLREQPEFADAG